MPTPSEIEQVFRENGVDVEGLRNAMQSKIDDGSLTKQQAQEYLLNQYNRLTSQKQEQPATQEEVETSGIVEGIGKIAGNAFAFGQGSRIAGALNTAPGRVFGAVLNPLGTIVRGQAPSFSIQELAPSAIAQAYQEGKSQFEQETKQFREEHPAASTMAEVGGTLAGLAGPAGAIGGIAKAGVAATRLGQAGILGRVASRVAGEAAAFGSYEGIREGFGEGQADAMAALKGAGKGAALGGALGILGGGMQAVEPTLVQKAIQMSVSPEHSQLLVKAFGIGAEGVTLGAVPAALEGEAPTTRDIGMGLAFAAGGRALAEGASYGMGRVREWLTKPTERELKVIEGKGIVNSLENRKELLKGQSKAVEGERSVQAIQKDLETKTTREQRQAKEGVAGDLIQELQPKLDRAEEDVANFMEEIGFERGRRVQNSEGTSRYLYFTKNGEEKIVRVAGHKSTKSSGHYDFSYDINKPVFENLKGIADKELSRVVGDDASLLQDIKGEASVSSRVTPTEEQVGSYMKADKTLTREQAIDLAEAANKKAALARRTGEPTIRQRAQNALESVRTTFNLVRPIEKVEETLFGKTGKALAYGDRSSVTLYKLANGGEWEAMSQPVVKEIKSAIKSSPKAMEKYAEYAQAKKNLQFKQNAGEAISAQDLRKVKLYENDQGVQAIDKAVKKMNQTVLEGLYKTGRINKATYEKWKANDSYVPSKVVKDYIDGDQIISRELEAFTKKYEGTGLIYENSALSSLIQGKSLYRFSELNRAKQQFVNAGSRTGDARLINANNNYAGGKINFNRNNEIVVWKDGNPQIWEVPEKVAKYFNPEKMEPVGAGLKTLGWFMNLYKGGTTATSLGFSYANVFRDVQSAVLGSKYGGYIGASSIRNAAKELIENTELAKLFRKEQGGKTILTTEQLPSIAKDSVREAVSTLEAAEKAFPAGSQRNGLARMFTATLPEYAKKVMRVSSKAKQTGLEGLTYAGQLGEETTRFSVFKSVLEAKAKNQAELNMWLRGHNIPKNVLAEAGNEAREVTLNFNKQMHPFIEKANRYVLPYFKPSILGAMRGFEVLTNPEIAPRAWRYIINLGVLQGLINGKMGTKEELERYEAINNEIVGKTFVLQGKDGKLFSLPLSQEFGPLTKLFSTMVEKIYRGATKQAREDLGREAWSAAKREAENLIPVVGYFTPSNMVPQPFKPIIELNINKELFTKTPIEPEYLKSLPASMRYNQNTSRTLVKLAEVASKLGVEISPLQMQHVVKGTVSSTGKEALALTDNILATLMSTDLRPKQDMENNPLIRRFMVDMYAPYNQYSMDAREIIDHNKQGYNAIEKDKVDINSPRGAKYAEQYYVYDTIKDYADELTNLYKDRKALLEELRQVGEYNRVQYETGKWDKTKLLAENDKAMREAEGALTYYKDYQRQLEIAIIRDSKEAKKEYKKNPR